MYIQTLFVLLFCYFPIQSFIFKNVIISASNLKIRGVSIYTIEMKRNLDQNDQPSNWNTLLVQQNDNISIIFPNEYLSLSEAKCSSIRIETNNNTNIFNNPVCIINNQQITITNAIPSSQYISQVIMTITNIINPSPAILTNYFKGFIGSDFSKQSIHSKIQLQTGLLASCQASFTIGKISQFDNLQVQIVAKQIMPFGTTVTVTLPPYWHRDENKTQHQIISSMKCNVNPSTTTKANCTGSLAQNSIIVKNIFNNTNSTNITIYSLRTPTSTEPIDQIQIKTQNSNGIPYDSCSTIISGLKPISINNINILSTVNVNTQVALHLSMSLIAAMTSNSHSISISFSNEYTPIYKLINVTDPNSQSIFTQVSKNATLINLTQSRNYRISQTFEFLLYNFIGPTSIATNPTISVDIYQYGYIQVQTQVTIHAITNILTDIKMVPSSPAVYQASLYSIIFTCPDIISDTSVILLILPFEIQVNAALIQINLNNQIVTKQISSNAIRISNLPSISTLPINITIVLSKLRNPENATTIKTPLSIRLLLKNDDSFLVASGSTIPSIVFNSSNTLQAAVSSSSNITNQKLVSLSFKIENVVPIRINNTLQIEFRNLAVSQKIKNVCYIKVTQSNDNATAIMSDYVLVAFELTSVNYSSTFILLQMPIYIGSGSIFFLRIDSLFTNPPHTKQLTSFTLKTQTKQNEIKQISINPFYLTINTPNKFEVFLLNRSSFKNKQLSQYQFSIVQQQQFTTGNNTIVITFPIDVSFQFASCLLCMININNKKVVFNLQDPINKLNIVLIVSNVTNAPSLAPINSISVQSYHQAVYKYSYSSNIDNPNALFNTLPSQLLLNSAAYSSGILTDMNQLTISFVFESKVQLVIITLSNLFNIDTSGLLCSIALGTNMICQTNKNIVNIKRTTNDSTQQTAQIVITNFMNPIQYHGNVRSQINSYDSKSSGVSSYSNNSNLLQWKPSCDLPCRTCSASNRSKCSSCYKNSSIVTEMLFDNSSSKCLYRCTQMQLESGNNCLSCDPKCKTCSISIDNCTSCDNNSSNPYLFHNECLNQCTNTTYKSLKLGSCEQCQSPCSQCVSKTNCTSCINGLYFHEDQCKASCPLGITIQNKINNTCDACSSQCYTCSNIVTNCLSCAFNAASYQNKCYLQCPNSLLIQAQKCVSNCQNLCSNCSIYSDNCTACNNSFLFGSECIQNCPQVYYANDTLNKCIPCSALSIHCSLNCTENPQCFSNSSIDCSIASYKFICYDCDKNYVLFQSRCLTQAPDGYIAINKIAQKCSLQCLTCVNSIDNCTWCNSQPIYDSRCVSKCPTSHYQSSSQVLFQNNLVKTRICVRCVTPCDTCNDISACLSCLTNFYLKGQQCVSASQCPVQFYADPFKLICQICVSPCFKCSDLHTCIQCVNNTYLHKSKCYSQCPSQYYEQNNTRLCTKCQSPCSWCNSALLCTSCLQPYFYFPLNSSCLLNCPPGYKIDLPTKLCTNCTEPCLICSSTHCSLCGMKDGLQYYLYAEICSKGCPPNYYAVNQTINYTCKLCINNCTQCLNTTYCILCISGYRFVDEGKCQMSCPSELPILKTIDHKIYCSPCSSKNCVECSINDECLQCANDTILFQGVCLNDCPEFYQKVQNMTNSNDSYNITNDSDDDNNQTNITYYCQPIIMNETVISEIYPIIISEPIPFISLICGGFLSLMAISFRIIICWKNPNSNIHIFSLLICSFVFPEMLSLGYTIFAHYLYNKDTTDNEWNLYLIGLLCVVIFLLIINIFSLIILNCFVLANDSMYLHWRSKNSYFQVFLIWIVNFFSIFSFKFQHFLWCGCSYFPILQNVSSLNYLSVSSLFSILPISAYIFISIKLIYLQPELFFIHIDGIVVICITLLLSLAALWRKNDLFIKKQNDNMTLNKRISSADQVINIPIKPNLQYQQYHNYDQQSRNYYQYIKSLYTNKFSDQSHSLLSQNSSRKSDFNDLGSIISSQRQIKSQRDGEHISVSNGDEWNSNFAVVDDGENTSYSAAELMHKVLTPKNHQIIQIKSYQRNKGEEICLKDIEDEEKMDRKNFHIKNQQYAQQNQQRILKLQKSSEQQQNQIINNNLNSEIQNYSLNQSNEFQKSKEIKKVVSNYSAEKISMLKKDLSQDISHFLDFQDILQNKKLATSKYLEEKEIKNTSKFIEQLKNDDIQNNVSQKEQQSHLQQKQQLQSQSKQQQNKRQQEKQYEQKYDEEQLNTSQVQASENKNQRMYVEMIQKARQQLHSRQQLFSIEMLQFESNKREEQSVQNQKIQHQIKGFQDKQLDNQESKKYCQYGSNKQNQNKSICSDRNGKQWENQMSQNNDYHTKIQQQEKHIQEQNNKQYKYISQKEDFNSKQVSEIQNKKQNAKKLGKQKEKQINRLYEEIDVQYQDKQGQILDEDDEDDEDDNIDNVVDFDDDDDDIYEVHNVHDISDDEEYEYKFDDESLLQNLSDLEIKQENEIEQLQRVTIHPLQTHEKQRENKQKKTIKQDLIFSKKQFTKLKRKKQPIQRKQIQTKQQYFSKRQNGFSKAKQFKKRISIKKKDYQALKKYAKQLQTEQHKSLQKTKNNLEKGSLSRKKKISLEKSSKKKSKQKQKVLLSIYKKQSTEKQKPSKK